jgi:hypothetical protein
VPTPSSAAGPQYGRGTPGASARREYERRQRRHDTRQAERIAADREWRTQVRADRPVLGRVLTAVTAPPTVEPAPQHVRAWAIGSVGEEVVGRALDAIDGVEALHDRRPKGRVGNIDHIAVTPSGVWVVDAKRYGGKRIEHRTGTWLRSVDELLVGGRRQTTLADKVAQQCAAVAAAGAGVLDDVPVRGALCFVEGEWPLFAKPFAVRGVAVCWPRALRSVVTRPARLDPHRIRRIAAGLAAALPPADRRTPGR